MLQKKTEIEYKEARDKIPNGCLLVYRPDDFYGLIISLSAISCRKWLDVLLHKEEMPPCHVARAIKWDNSIWAVQQTAKPYNKLERLSKVIKSRSGKVDVYRLKKEYLSQYNLEKALEVHKDICLQAYGWRNLLRVINRHIWFLSKNINDKITSKCPPFCSMAYAMSDRAAGIDPCPGLADQDTEPIDLQYSTYYEYMFTLI